jgi:hypothetical protein
MTRRTIEDQQYPRLQSVARLHNGTKSGGPVPHGDIITPTVCAGPKLKRGSAGRELIQNILWQGTCSSCFWQQHLWKMWLHCRIRTDATEKSAAEDGPTRPTGDSRQIRRCPHACIYYPPFVSVVTGTHGGLVHVDDNMIEVSETTTKQPLSPAQKYQNLVSVITIRSIRNSRFMLP